jgi:hypothetical protein
MARRQMSVKISFRLEISMNSDKADVTRAGFFLCFELREPELLLAEIMSSIASRMANDSRDTSDFVYLHFLILTARRA